jgi:hypothetical protein
MVKEQEKFLVANQIQDLRDRLSDAKTIISNEQQTQALLNITGQWRAYPPVNPCTCYSTCCNTNI